LGWWRRWGWARRILAALCVVVGLYFMTLVTIGLLQADFDATTFESGSSFRVQLDQGEARSVYLTPRESDPLNFDFYPSDLDCRMQGSDGDVVEGEVLREEKRLVDAWSMHWGVASFTTPVSGTYELTCRDQADRTHPLVLASPSRIDPTKVSPSFGLFLLLLVLVPFAVALFVGGRRDRSRAGA
jgi:hypothetical protein